MIKNRTQLDSLLMLKLQSVINSLAERLTNELMNFIEEEVYSYNPSFYQRTYEFKDSWEHSIATVKGNIVQSEIFQNYATMVFNPENWQHGSIYSGKLNVNGLNEIINAGKIGNMANFPQLGARPFWDKFQEYVEQNIGELFKQECQRQGISLTNGNSFYNFS